MKKITIYTLSAILVSASITYGQNSAYTNPSGYVSLGNTDEGQPAVAANTDLYATIPLLQATQYTGKLELPSEANKLQFQTGAAFTAGQWTGSAHCVVITSGAKEGLTAIIQSHTADELTLTLPNGSSLTGIVADDTAKIIPCWTASTLFGDSVIPPGTNMFFYDVGPGETNSSAKVALVYGGAAAGWFYQFDLINGTTGSANDFIIHPSEGFVIRTGASPITKLVVTGAVPVTKHSAILTKAVAGQAEDNIVGYTSPVGEKMSATGLGVTAGDSILIYDKKAQGQNKSAQIGLVYGGEAAGWFYQFDLINGNTGSANDYVLEPGTAFVYRRIANAPTGNVEWSSLPSYVPGLND
ncbi:MAG: TIGR02597 family protein [Akkermansiaceae bacterium]